MSWFSAVDGGVEVSLSGPEIAVLSRLGSLLGGAGVENDDPARERLLPVVYPDDPEASREFDRLASKERVEARSVDREAFVAGLTAAASGTTMLRAEDAAAWARVLGEARIVVASRKGLFETGLPEGPIDDPEVAFLTFLGLLQEELVGAMLTSMDGAK